jgi:hypothetical protein
MRNAPTVNGERLRVDGDERPRSKHHTAVAGELLSSPKGLMNSYFRNREAMAACSRGLTPAATCGRHFVAKTRNFNTCASGKCRQEHRRGLFDRPHFQ